MSNTPYFQSPLNILLIEDSEADALLIERELKSVIFEDYFLQKAATLEEAIRLLSKNSFHVALLDRSLPDADGFDGLYSLQNIAPNLPLVFLTSYQNEQIALESIKQGAQDYLLKDKSNGSVIKRAIHFAMLRKQFESILIERANFDLLTGLANRWLFENRLEIAIAKMKRDKDIFALLFLDLDFFKNINDVHGHAAGDQVLKNVGERLKQIFRPYDTVARLGGDEFVVLLESIQDIQDIVETAKRIISLLEEPIPVFGNELTVGVSIGIVICDKENMLAETLVKHADKAMYHAKSKPGSSYCLSDGYTNIEA